MMISLPSGAGRTLSRPGFVGQGARAGKAGGAVGAVVLLLPPGLHRDAAVDRLAAMPTGRKGRVSGTYEKPVSGLPYIIAYALGDEPKGHETVTILRIVHNARNWPEESCPE